MRITSKMWASETPASPEMLTFLLSTGQQGDVFLIIVFVACKLLKEELDDNFSCLIFKSQFCIFCLCSPHRDLSLLAATGHWWCQSGIFHSGETLCAKSISRTSPETQDSLQGTHLSSPAAKGTKKGGHSFVRILCASLPWTSTALPGQD